MSQRRPHLNILDMDSLLTAEPHAELITMKSFMEYNEAHQSPGNNMTRILSLTMSQSLYLIKWHGIIPLLSVIQGKSVTASFLQSLQSVVQPDTASLPHYLCKTGTGQSAPLLPPAINV